jgi:PadR family transcriptional regulator, regulatory protein PadR
VDDAATELRKGALDVLILKTLSWGAAHGYAISRWIRETTGGTLRIEEGALYPALHRMERKGWIESKWILSETNRRVKSYRITSAGSAQLRSEGASWSSFAAAMAKVLNGTQPPEWVRQA